MANCKDRLFLVIQVCQELRDEERAGGPLDDGILADHGETVGLPDPFLDQDLPVRGEVTEVPDWLW